MAQQDALEQLHGFVDTLETAMNAEFELDVGEINSMMICAMGGSAISANIVADCCSSYIDIPISINRSPLLPKWVGPRTLSIISSYSGNTDETIEMYNRARDAGSPIVVIVSGGRIEEMAERDGYLALKIPTGLQPRFSIGYMIGYICAIMGRIGYPQFRERLEPILGSLRNYRNYLEAPGSLSHLLANKLRYTVPVICTENKFRSVSLRWKGQMNENSKIICFSTALSEFNYCEANPWSKYRGNRMNLVVLVGEDDLADGSAVKNAVKNIETLGFPFELVAISGATHEERVFRALLLGDYLSVFIADLKRIDAADVGVITELKRRIHS